MGRTSSILKLPAPVRDGLGKLYQAGATLDDIVTAIEDQFGVTLSRSTVHRHRLNFEAVADKMREAKEIAQALASEIGDIPQDKTGQLLIELLHTMIFRFLARAAEDDGSDEEKATDDLKSQDFAFLAGSIKDIATAAKVSDERVRAMRKEIAAKVAADAKEAAAQVQEIAREGGLSQKMADQMKALVLGVKVTPDG